MEELFKNSPLGQLNGFSAKNGANFGVPFNIPEDKLLEIESEPNPLEINLNGADINNSPFVNNPVKEKREADSVAFKGKALEGAKRRLNDLDFNILQDSALKKAGEEYTGGNILGKFLHKYFPNVYKNFMVKKALKKLQTLNETTVELLSKKVPYGEAEQRYDALTGYLTSANTIHSRLMKKI